MSPVHHSVLLYVVNFLRDAIKHSPEDCVEERTSKIGKSIVPSILTQKKTSVMANMIVLSSSGYLRDCLDASSSKLQ